MADKITYDDIFDTKILKQLVDNFKKAEKDIKAVFDRIKKDAQSIDFSGKGMKDFEAAIKRIEKLERELKAAQDARAKNQKNIEAAQKRQNELLSKNSQALANVKEQNRKLSQEQRQNAKVVTAQDNSYDKLTAELNQNIAAWKKMSKEQRENTNEGKKLTKTIQQQDRELKKLDKSIGRSQRNVGNYGTALKGATKLLGMFGVALGGAAMIGFFRKSLANFGAQEAAEKSLEVALGRTSKALLNQASALQAITKFGDEATIQGQAFLAQMGLTEREILKVTPLILDFAEAQGMNVSDAFKLVAKTLGSSTNALSRYGIEVEGAVGSSDRLDSAVNALSKAFKGQAQAAAEVGTGALTQLSNLWGDLTERVGGFLANALNPYVRIMSGWLSSSDDVIKNLNRERLEINQLAAAAMSANATQEIRVRIIGDLQSKYPDFLSNLDAEKVTNEDIAEALISVNEQYKIRIAEAVAQKELADEEQKIVNLYQLEIGILKDIENLRKSGASDELIESMEEGLEKTRETRAELEKSVIARRLEIEQLVKAGELYKSGNEEQKTVITTINTLNTEIANLKKQKDELSVTDIQGHLNIQKEIDLRQKQIDKLAETIKHLNAYKTAMGADEPEFTDTPDELPLEMPEPDDAEFQAQLDATEEFIQDRQDLYLEDAEFQKNLQKEVKDSAVDAAHSTVSAIFDIMNSFRERELQDIEAQRQYELELYEGNVAKQEEINERYDEREKEIKRKQDRANKIQSIFEVALSTATAIAKASPVVPLMAFAAIIGAAQIAAIAARPLPQYAKGTDSAEGGWSIVGEKGQEMLITPDGVVSLSGDTAEVRDLEKGTRVIPHERTREILDNGMIATLGGRTIQPYNSHLDMKEVERLQGEQLAQQKRTNKLLKGYRYSVRNKVYDLEGNSIEHV